MINRIKGFALVHGPTLGIAAIVTALLLLGGICGYAISSMEASRKSQNLRISHLRELNHLDNSHRFTVDYFASRVQELIALQVETANDLSATQKELRKAREQLQSACK